MKPEKFKYRKIEEIILLSPCSNCKHKYTDAFGCKAFPIEIPESIILGEDKHTEKYPGQENDIVFEPIEEGE